MQSGKIGVGGGGGGCLHTGSFNMDFGHTTAFSELCGTSFMCIFSFCIQFHEVIY